MKGFAASTLMTSLTGVLSLFIGVGTSVLLARTLGPEGRGIYALAMLLPSMIVTFGNLGIGAATVFYVARGEYRRQQILGNNILIGLFVSVLGVGIGALGVALFRDALFPGVSPCHLFLALILIPIKLFFSFVRYVLLGAQQIVRFNIGELTHTVLFLTILAPALLLFDAGVLGAIIAALASWVFADIWVFAQAKKVCGGIAFAPSKQYIKSAATYGSQVQAANILGFLNYRVDMFLVSGFLGPAALGMYAVGVALVEKLWMVSHAASTVLFPRVAAESDEHRRKEFTPLIARTVLWSTTLAAIVLGVLSRRIVLLLYSSVFLPAADALQALLVGVIALSVGRVVSNDVSGRGFPRVSIYTGAVAVICNVSLNLLWIPRYGIVGAAWASTASYLAASLVALAFYCRLSGNSWTVVVFPQRGDWMLYWKAARGVSLWGVRLLRRLVLRRGRW